MRQLVRVSMGACMHALDLLLGFIKIVPEHSDPQNFLQD